jgi:hypothetical protein
MSESSVNQDKLKKKYEVSEKGKKTCTKCTETKRGNQFIGGSDICTKCRNAEARAAKEQADLTAKFEALHATRSTHLQNERSLPQVPEFKTREEQLEAELQQTRRQLYSIQEEFTSLGTKNAELEAKLRVMEEQNRAKAELLIERGSVIMQLQRSPSALVQRFPEPQRVQREAPHSAPIKYPDSPSLSSASSTSSRASTPSTPPRLGSKSMDKKLKECPECKRVLLKATFFARSRRRCRDCELKNPN